MPRIFVPASMTMPLGRELILASIACFPRAFGAGEDKDAARDEMAALSGALTTLTSFHGTGVDPVHLDVGHECVLAVVERTRLLEAA